MGRIIPAKLIPLKTAPWAFASQRLRDEWSRAQEAARPPKSKLNSGSTELLKTQASENPPGSFGEGFMKVAEIVDGILTYVRVKSELLEAMQKSLVQKLEAGKLEACGVQSAPKQKRHLEVLREHFFADAKINWDENEVINFGVTYGAVRVRRRSSLTSQASTEKWLSAPANAPSGVLAKTADQEPSEAQRRKPGPSSVAGEVIAAYNELLHKGVLKETMTIAEMHQKLFPVLKKLVPNERGLAYSSIARHLRAHIAGRSKLSS